MNSNERKSKISTHSLFNEKNQMKEALVIVAHPDDETIWAGGMILKNSQWDWTIISLCRKNDSDRMPKFLGVCNFYKANAIISDLDDEKLEPLPIKEIIEKIKLLLPKNKYDYIFTHGENGEYGHLRHKEVHRAVKKMIEKKDLECEKTYYFSYEKGKNSTPGIPDLKIPEPNENSDLVIHLNNHQYLNKLKLIKDFYGFNNDSFETLSCNKDEAFSIK